MNETLNPAADLITEIAAAVIADHLWTQKSLVSLAELAQQLRNIGIETSGETCLAPSCRDNSCTGEVLLHDNRIYPVVSSTFATALNGLLEREVIVGIDLTELPPLPRRRPYVVPVTYKVGPKMRRRWCKDPTHMELLMGRLEGTK